MITVAGLLEGPTEPAPMLAETGFSQIDDLTGGLRRGAVWIVTGAPGEGTSLLLLQLALGFAMAGRRTALHAPRGTRHDLRHRILAHLAQTPVGRPVGEQEDAFRLAATLPLRIGAGPWSHGSIDPSDGEISVADDADLMTSPEEVRDLARRGHTVVLGLPLDQVVSEAGLDPSWARVADVVLQVETGCWTGADHTEPSTLRLVKHRWGPLREQAVSFEPAFARFRDVTSDSVRNSAQS